MHHYSSLAIFVLYGIYPYLSFIQMWVLHSFVLYFQPHDKPHGRAMGSLSWILKEKWPPWWRHQMETFSALLAICAGNSPVTGEFLTQRPVTRNFDARMNGWVNNREASDLRRYRVHYDVIVMIYRGRTLLTWRMFRCWCQGGEKQQETGRYPSHSSGS